MLDYRKLEFWKESHQLTLRIYKLTRTFPQEEQFALVSQIRRAAYSIPTNIAEGCGRESRADLAHFFQMAIGSAKEVGYELLLCKDLGYISDSQYQELQKLVTDIELKLVAYTANIRHSINNKE